VPCLIPECWLAGRSRHRGWPPRVWICVELTSPTMPRWGLCIFSDSDRRQWHPANKHFTEVYESQVSTTDVIHIYHLISHGSACSPGRWSRSARRANSSPPGSDKKYERAAMRSARSVASTK